MNTQIDHEPPRGKQPSEEDEFYFQWGMESQKNNIVLANDILKQFITLNSTLLGGSVVFIDSAVMSPSAKNIVIIFFFLGLAAAFFGVLPYERKVLRASPTEVEKYKASALKKKRSFLWLAALFMAIGFLVAILGFLVVKRC